MMPHISRHHIRDQMFGKQFPQLESAGMSLEPGELVLYGGRLAEVIYDGKRGGPPVVEITDEGGIVHSYAVRDRTKLQELVERGECVLDGMRRAAGRKLGPQEKLRREAERWLADPQVGDTFLVSGEVLELVSIGEGGTIWGSITGPKEAAADGPVRGISFAGARTLRNWLKSDWVPVYSALALHSLRPTSNHKNTSVPGGEVARYPHEGGMCTE